MSAALAVDLVLAILVLGMAVWTFVARDTLAAIVGFVAFGLLLLLVWMRLGAPDVAMTEGAIGSGLSGMLLLGAASRLRATEDEMERERPKRGQRIAIALLASTIAIGLGWVVVSLPDPAPSLAAVTAEKLPSAQLGNPVTGVLMVFRGIDTLLEKVVLFLAVIGVWCLSSDRAWGGQPRVDAARASPPLIFLARVLPPFGILLGAYLVWIGADAPGGAFPGGAMWAAMALLVLIAGITRTPRSASWRLRVALVAAPLVFMVVGLAGLPLFGHFLAYPDGWVKVTIVFIEVFMIATIAVTLALLLAGPPSTSGDPLVEAGGTP